MRNSSKTFLEKLLVAIALITIVTGFCQVVIPEPMLQIVGSEISTTSMHFFAIEGMFMVLFGGLLFHALSVQQRNEVAILWTAFQKMGATIAVTIGIIKGVFATLVALVAAFDLLSSVLIFIYWNSLKTVANIKTA